MSDTLILKEISACKGTPNPRSGHRCCATSNHLIVYGGYNKDLGNKVFSEILCYNVISRQWIEVPNSRDVRTEAASSSMIIDGNSLIIFGGSGYPFGYTNTNKVSVFSLSFLQWLSIDDGKSDEAPTPKYGQSMVLCKKEQRPRLYVFSGTVGREFLEEMHYFDIIERSWHRIESTHSPKARYRHEVVADRNCFYIFGGAVTGSTFGFETIDRFCFDSHSWENLICKPTEDGTYPLPRKSHSCVLYGRDVYMCGGMNSFGVYCDDIWKINLDKLTWSRLPVRFPVTLHFHSAAVSPDGCMYVFGGVVGDDKRTSATYELWLDVPPLFKLCLRYIIDRTCHKANDTYKILKDLNISTSLLDRLFQDLPTA